MSGPILAVFSLVLGTGGIPADTTRSSECPGGQTLERSDLRSVILMTDLLGRLDGVSLSTMDGFDVRPHAGPAPVGDPPWLVLIDGVPVEMGAFGFSELHLLPVEPGEILRVLYCPGPALAAGRFAASGRLEITTTRRVATPRWSALGEARIGNETGDPGPYRYLPAAAPNVDKIGPDISIVGGAPFVTVGGRFERRYPSDPASFERNQAILGGYPAIRYGALGMHIEPPGTPIRFDAGGAYASDLWYLSAAGRELPVRRLAGQGAVTAGTTLRRLALGARGAVSAASVDRRPEMPDSVDAGFDPAWQELSGRLDLEARLPGSRRTLAGGIHLRGTSAVGPGLDNCCIGLLRLWLHRAGDPRPGWGRRSDIAIVSGRDHVGLEGAVAIERRLPAGGAVAFTVSRDDRVPEEHPGAAFWRSRGYAGLDRPESPYAAAASIERGTEWAARLDATIPVLRTGVVRGSAWSSDYRGLTLERGTFRPDSTAGVTGDVVAGGGHHGRTAALLLAASAAQGRWALGASYRYEHIVAGDDAFRSAWAVVPEHLARTYVRLEPDRSLLLRLAIEARSSARWNAYGAFEGVEYIGGGLYHRRVPSAVLVTIDIEKTLFDEHLSLSASVRNALNATERGHPLGAELALRLWTRVTMRF